MLKETRTGEDRRLFVCYINCVLLFFLGGGFFSKQREEVIINLLQVVQHFINIASQIFPFLNYTTITDSTMMKHD